jgi:CHAT domain-containing protein
MKKLFLLLFLLLSNYTKGQTTQEIKDQFWKAIELSDNEKIVENGEKLIQFIELKTNQIDSNSILIFLKTGEAYIALFNYQKGLEINLKVKNIIENYLSKENPYYPKVLYNISLCYTYEGNFKKSLEYNYEVLDIYEKTIGYEHLDYAKNLYNISLNYCFLKEYTKALDFSLYDLIITKDRGNNSQELAESFFNVASIYFYLGDYSISILYYLDALNLYKTKFGKLHPYYLESIDKISLNYSLLMNYSKSLEYNFEALKIREILVGKEDINYAENLISISLNYSRLGIHNKALAYNLLALKIYEKTLGIESSNYILCLNNISANYFYLNNLSKSLEYNFNVLNIREKIVGKEHRDYAVTLSNIASIYLIMGKYEVGQKYIEKALKIFEKYKIIELYAYSNTLNIFSTFLYKNGKHKKALKLKLKALKINKILNNYNISFAMNMGDISLNYMCLKEFEKAFNYGLDYANLMLMFFYENKFGQDNNSRIIMKQNVESAFILLNNVFMKYKNNPEKLYEIWINLNGIIKSDEMAVQSKIFNSKDTSLIHLAEKLKLCNLQLNIFKEMNLKERKEKENDIINYEKEKQIIEMELSRKSKDFAELQRNITLNDIKNNLNNNEVLVEIVPFPVYSLSSHSYIDSTKYIVFIMDGRDTLVEHLIIEDGNHLDEIFLSYRKQTMSLNGKSDLKSSIFYNSFWKSISDKIGNAKTVYVSLGGVYNNINLNTLYNNQTGKYLLEEKDIRIVNSARDFVLGKEREKTIYSNNTACLFGFPNYDGNNTSVTDTFNYFANNRDLNSFWIDSLTRGGLKAKPLPETKLEVEYISKTLNNKGWNTTTYLADDASETEIKKQISPRILHIATHGYFFEDIPLDTTNKLFLGIDRNFLIQDPMLRSGLLFTGANKTLKGEEVKGENGLLSAAEASLLDLRGTELVVLSACETGKGEIKNGEGVYGLRKAFADAGARNMIMSLWKVDDKVTQEFMTRFYEVWLNEKITIRQAFNKTQIEIKNKYPEPYYWGAFILVGE